jgi:hypothetical protein
MKSARERAPFQGPNSHSLGGESIGSQPPQVPSKAHRAPRSRVQPCSQRRRNAPWSPLDSMAVGLRASCGRFVASQPVERPCAAVLRRRGAISALHSRQHSQVAGVAPAFPTRDEPRQPHVFSPYSGSDLPSLENVWLRCRANELQISDEENSLTLSKKMRHYIS